MEDTSSRLRAAAKRLSVAPGVRAGSGSVRKKYDGLSVDGAVVAALVPLLDQCPVALIATDLEGRVTHWNHAAQTVYQWSPSEAIGQYVQLLGCWPEHPAETTPHASDEPCEADTLDLMTTTRRRRPTGYCRLVSTNSGTTTPIDHTRTAALISSLQRQLLDLATR
jgi:PAS domain S-box-containing protein